MVKPDCNQYEGGKVPPCSAFLDNANPIIKDGKLIFKNENRLFYFISASPKNTSQAGSPGSLPGIATYTNLQIGLATFIVGLFIDQIQREVIEYDKSCEIHSDKTANLFVHKAIQNPPELDFDFIPTLSLVISNGNAILPLYTYTVNISSLNFFILFVLNRLEGNPAFFFGNNSFAEEDILNFTLADMKLKFPLF